MNELTINLHTASETPLYEQIYQHIKREIQEGRITSGEKLPSSRSLCKYLEVSRSTVELAYEQLISEGYVEAVPCKGYFAAELEGMYRLDVVPALVGAEEKTEKKEWKYNFTPNGVDLNSFPYNVWRRLAKDSLLDDRAEMFRLGDSQGEYGLRSAISRYLYQARGVNAHPDQIIIGAGTEYLYSILIQLLGRNVCYGVENPGYPKIAKIYRSMGVKYEYIDLDEEGTSAKKLEEKKVDIMHISPSHHFPTGMVMPISKRYELLGWVTREKERYIIEDDYDSELRLAGKPIPSLQSIDVSGKVIYINTFAKTLCSTVRISYMVLPEALAEKYYRELSFYSCTVSNFEQYTLAAFMNAGAFEKHINRLRNYYQHKRDLILSTFLREPLGKYITISEEDSGVHFLMHVNTSMSEQEFLLKTRAKGIRLATLSSFYNAEQKDSRYENTYVMNYSFVNCDRLEYVAQTLYKIIHP